MIPPEAVCTEKPGRCPVHGRHREAKPVPAPVGHDELMLFGEELFGESEEG